MSMVQMGKMDVELMKGILREVEAHKLQFFNFHQRFIRQTQQRKPEAFITLGPRSAQFEMQAAVIPNQNKFEYQTARKLVDTVEAFLRTGLQEFVLYLDGISASEQEATEKELHRIGLKHMVRFTFENALHAAILDIRPGPCADSWGSCAAAYQ